MRKLSFLCDKLKSCKFVVSKNESIFTEFSYFMDDRWRRKTQYFAQYKNLKTIWKKWKQMCISYTTHQVTIIMILQNNENEQSNQVDYEIKCTFSDNVIYILFLFLHFSLHFCFISSMWESKNYSIHHLTSSVTKIIIFCSHLHSSTFSYMFSYTIPQFRLYLRWKRAD